MQFTDTVFQEEVQLMEVTKHVDYGEKVLFDTRQQTNKWSHQEIQELLNKALVPGGVAFGIIQKGEEIQKNGFLFLSKIDLFNKAFSDCSNYRVYCRMRHLFIEGFSHDKFIKYEVRLVSDPGRDYLARSKDSFILQRRGEQYVLEKVMQYFSLLPKIPKVYRK